MGNRPKPTVLKLLQGNPGKRPINKDEPVPRSTKPVMPEWLKDMPFAVAEWDRELKELEAMGLANEADAGNFAQRCALAALIQNALMDLKLGIETKYTQVTNLISQYRQMGGVLGLDPTSRTRLKSDRPKQKSKIDAFMEKRYGE